ARRGLPQVLRAERPAYKKRRCLRNGDLCVAEERELASSGRVGGQCDRHIQAGVVRRDPEEAAGSVVSGLFDEVPPSRLRIVDEDLGGGEVEAALSALERSDLHD